VGKNYEDNLISSTPVEISYDSTYTEQAVFAGLLSSEDNFASTLRYSETGDSSIEISKQRELSGGESEMKADDFGWMVMDLAPNQPNMETSVNQMTLRKSMLFYPNPAKHTVHFNFIKPTHVEILDLAGHKLLDANVSQSLNIGSLIPGVYLVKGEGYLPGILIKEK
jgi:hypothetical protein